MKSISNRHGGQKATSVGILASLLIAFLFQKIVYGAPCPNSCSGNGRCSNPSMKCQCFAGFTGSDCSEYLCPNGTAWFDIATGIDAAHNTAECSNMGICDRVTGACTCKAGFTGAACERLACPGSTPCNNVGECRSMYFNALSKDKGVGTTYSYNSIWDSHKIWGCTCGFSFNGSDCSLRVCPTGDDPLTGSGTSTATNPNQFNAIQRVTCYAGGGTFTLAYLGQTTTPISYAAGATDIANALGALPLLGSAANVKITMYGPKACLAAGTQFTVQFLQNFGNLPLLVPDSTNLFFQNSLSQVQLTVVTTTAGTKENDACSNRGICDPTVGFCTCLTGYTTSNGYNKAGLRGDCGYVTSTVTSCPGAVACSAHGVCAGTPTWRCNCAVGWIGADCSERTCPLDVAWYTYPSANNVAHIYEQVECGNVGNCDRASGICICAPGFSGQACEYMSCPGNTQPCNGHGKCITIGAAAALATDSNGLSTPYTYGATPNNPATWDANKIYGCYCDVGYTGYDCSQKYCPYGYDPEDLVNTFEVQSITCTATKGSFWVILSSQKSTAISYSATTVDVAAAIQALPNVGSVAVTSTNALYNTACTSKGNTLRVTFISSDLNIPLMNVTSSSISSISVAQISKGSKVLVECAGRGICDRSTGTCACFPGYGSSDGFGNFVGISGDCGYLKPESVVSQIN